MSDAGVTASRIEARHVPAHVLVVDDNLLNRRKLQFAIENLGHTVDTADDGESALTALSRRRYDAIILDLLMPKVDGFEVLRTIKSDDELRHVPVIVVSALDGDLSSVVRAIELGAEDFLPKDFEPVVLKARLGTLLVGKRFRDREIEYLDRVEQLTAAAQTVETGRFDPRSLDLDGLVAFDDPLGKLAVVFRGMAGEIYQRELRFTRTIQTLQGMMLVLLFGFIWGLSPALSRMASGIGSNPIGLAVWVNAIAAVACLSIAFFRGKLQMLTRGELLFFLSWALLAGILQRLTMFALAEHVEATLLSLVVALQGLMVFAFAATTGMERASPRRLLGLTVGLLGIVALLLMRYDPANATANLWLVAALSLPLVMAVESLTVAGRRPERVDNYAGVGFMLALSLIFLVPLAFVMDDFMTLDAAIGRTEIIVVVLGFVAASTNLLYLHIIATAGPVFASQIGYACTFAGVLLGMLLLDEKMPPVAWLAFVLVLIGMYLVEPKPSNDEVIVKRKFTQVPEGG